MAQNKEKKNIRPTLRQKKAARITHDLMASGKKITKGKILDKAGYAKSMQKDPKKVMESEGYLQELSKYGLTRELVTSALVEDIEDKKGKRYQELRLGAEVLGMKQSPQVAVQVNVPTTLVDMFKSPQDIQEGYVEPQEQ